jgi:hypothetical protein
MSFLDRLTSKSRELVALRECLISPFICHAEGRSPEASLNLLLHNERVFARLKGARSE